VFALLVGLCLVIAGGYVVFAALRDEPKEGGSLTGPIEGDSEVQEIAMIDSGPGSVLFQNVVPGDQWGRIGSIELGGAEWPRTMLPLECLRISYAAEVGLCLAEDPGLVTNYAAYVFGPDFHELHKVDLAGVPSRARVSRDGRYGATTVFVTGHSYAEGGFSTETSLIDLASGEKLANLEDFTVLRDGSTFDSADFNFWGVTFTQDSNLFYATLGTQGDTYLIEGRVDSREATVLRDNVECPSLSPDGTRVAFKKQVGRRLGAVTWRFHVLDLATGIETPLAETRSIDDQMEWLDNDRLLYGEGADTWLVAADGSGAPERFMSQAVNPTVVRTASVLAASSGQTPAESQAPGDTLTLAPADLGLEVAAPESAPAGSDVTTTVTITNHGPGDASSVLFEYYLPEGATYKSATTISLESGSWGCTMHPDENRVTCDTIALASGGSWVIEVTLTPESAGAYESSVHIYAAEPDPSPDNNDAPIVLTAT
jgi:uncharacterized repeat protein (TIGR01451 family)